MPLQRAICGLSIRANRHSVEAIVAVVTPRLSFAESVQSDHDVFEVAIRFVECAMVERAASVDLNGR
jgi:hypothetical protein